MTGQLAVVVQPGRLRLRLPAPAARLLPPR